MTFDNIHGQQQEQDCNCLLGCTENTNEMFGRRAYQEKLKNTDFKSPWEKGQRGSDCDETCGLKGLSFTRYSDTNRDSSLKYLAESIPLAPNYKPNVLIVKFKEKAGVVKNTPTKDPNNPEHHDFYKSDQFALESMELVECVNLVEYVQAS